MTSALFLAVQDQWPRACQPHHRRADVPVLGERRRRRRLAHDASRACWRIPAPGWCSSRRPTSSGAAASRMAASASIRTTARRRSTRVIAHCKRIGTAKFGIQIAHAGRKASSARAVGGRGGAQARIRTRGRRSARRRSRSAPTGPRRAQMDEADIAQVRDAFVDRREARAARRLRHDPAAHGARLPDPRLRLADLEQAQRRYGGALEGRMKFPLEVLRAVRAVVPKGYPLGARISAVDWMDGGLTGDDAVHWVAAMKESGLDFVDVSSGGVTADVRTPTTPGYNVPIAEQIKRETGIATRVVGLIATPRQAEDDRRRGQGRHDRARPRHAGRSALGLDGGARSWAPTSRGRTSICAPRRSCGPAPPLSRQRRLEASDGCRGWRRRRGLPHRINLRCARTARGEARAHRKKEGAWRITGDQPRRHSPKPPPSAPAAG